MYPIYTDTDNAITVTVMGVSIEGKYVRMPLKRSSRRTTLCTIVSPRPGEMEGEGCRGGVGEEG